MMRFIKTPHKSPAATILLAGLVTSQLGATDCGNVLRDPGFDLWCGDQLCAWKVERGNVQRVPTWNEGDPGVELVGANVAIEQLSPVASSDGSCIEFDLLADVDIDAEVHLNIDVYGDGSVEAFEPIQTTHWAPVSFKLPITGSYSGVRFEIEKLGAGHAALAQISAKITTGCGGLSPIQPDPAPLGAPCASDDNCASGLCEAAPYFRQCVACDDGAHACPAGSVCGLGDPTSPVRDLPRECVPVASRELGEPCLTDGECTTGICTNSFGQPSQLVPGGNHGTCSTCEPTTHPCANGATCNGAWLSGLDVTQFGATPWVCNPGQHTGAHGDPCATDDDCASSACSGTVRKQCNDGRSCATAATCPFGDGSPNTDNPFENGPCTTVGVQGGTCQ